MGLASFNRMRRSRKPVSAIETERFMADNASRNQTRVDRLAVHRENRARLDEVRDAERDASQEIGKKVEAGLKTSVADIHMRRDHAAEIAGRNLDGVQDSKTPMERLDARIPSATTANEKLADQMGVSLPGPNPSLIAAAREETGALDPAQRKRDMGPRAERDPADTRPQTDASGKTPMEQEAAKPARQRRQKEIPADGTPERAAQLAERSAVAIPPNWRDMAWPAQRKLAAQISDTKINTSPEAQAAIQAELTRRG